MASVQEFLLSNPVVDLTKVVVVSERLKDYPFTIKPVTTDEQQEYQRMCIKNPASKKKRTFDVQQYNNLIVKNHVVNPNFKDADFLSQAGPGTTSEMLINRVLMSGEVSKLVEEILKFSGFDTDLDEDVEEVKNS